MSCLEQGSPKHTLLYCTIWKKEEKQCRIAIAVKITVHTIIEQMGEDKYNWDNIAGFMGTITKKMPTPKCKAVLGRKITHLVGSPVRTIKIMGPWLHANVFFPPLLNIKSDLVKPGPV